MEYHGESIMCSVYLVMRGDEYVGMMVNCDHIFILEHGYMVNVSAGI